MGACCPPSLRCWSSEKQPQPGELAPPCPLQPPSLTLSPWLPVRAVLSHTLLYASQFAMIALLRAEEHLAHPVAQLELLYNTIRGSMGRFARVRASLLVPCDRVVRRARVAARVLSLFNGSISNGVSSGRARESDPTRVVNDFVMRPSVNPRPRCSARTIKRNSDLHDRSIVA